jgi:hypothetical protein
MRSYLPLLVSLFSFPIWGTGFYLIMTGNKTLAFYTLLIVIFIVSLALFLDKLNGKDENKTY